MAASDTASTYATTVANRIHFLCDLDAIFVAVFTPDLSPAANGAPLLADAFDRKFTELASSLTIILNQLR